MRVAFGFAVLFPALCLAQQGPVSVDVAAVQRRPVALTQPLVASVEPVTRSTLAAELPGLISERMFDEGQSIEKGAVLARMKTDLLQAQLNAAAAAEATAVANIAVAQAEAENAKEELARNEQLRKSNVGSEKELRDAATAFRVAEATVRAKGAEKDEKAADVARLKLMIEKSQVIAPVPGVVAERHVEVGQWVKEGDPVADIVQLDPLWVRVSVPESVVPRLAKGDEARLTIDALGGQQFTGTVDQILPEADPGSRGFPVKLLVSNADLKIRPGFFARATLVSKSKTELVVPKDAVVQRGPAAHVVAMRDGKAAVVPVKRGTSEGDMIAVAGDLTEKDLVVTRGNEALRGGEPLMPPPPAPPAAAQQPAADASR